MPLMHRKRSSRHDLRPAQVQIRHVPDFPKPGILFYDITTLLRDPEGLALALDSLGEPYVDTPIDLVVGMESRGFIFGAALAYRLGAGFVPVRKVGKLPSSTVKVTYDSSTAPIRWRFTKMRLTRASAC